MTLFIFRYHRQWGTGVAGIIAADFAAAIGMSDHCLSTADLVTQREIIGEAGILFDEFIDDPEYEG